MPKIRITVSKYDLGRIGRHQFLRYCREQGLDTSKNYDIYKDISAHHGMSIIGEALPNRIVRLIKTCIGIIPITEPWEGIIRNAG